MTNAERQARFRERRKQEKEAEAAKPTWVKVMEAALAEPDDTAGK